VSQTLSIQVPQLLLDRLHRLAAAAHRPVEELVVEALNDAVPTPPPGLPIDLHRELESLETLPDQALWQAARATMAPNDVPASYSPGDAGDRLMLRKAYALALLKWRGHSLTGFDDVAA